MSKWVQHKSGQGEKWEVLPTARPDGLAESYCVKVSREWCVRAKDDDKGWHILPKSEYVPCDPPERWVDVTERCKLNTHGTLVHFDGADHSVNGVILSVQDGYRIRKVDLWKPVENENRSTVQSAFIVEQREP